MPLNREISLNVLLVEDDENAAFLLREMLNVAEGLNCTLVVASCLSEACAELATKEFDIILSDLSLPDGRRLDAVKTLHAAAPALPIVVLTGLQDEAMAIAAIQAGAQDYLVKDKTGVMMLVRRLRYAFERVRVQESLRIALAEKEAPR